MKLRYTSIATLHFNLHEARKQEEIGGAERKVAHFRRLLLLAASILKVQAAFINLRTVAQVRDTRVDAKGL